MALRCAFVIAVAASNFHPSTGTAAAEFIDGVEAYEAKDFARARAVFLDLAELGHATSQHNLGAMLLRGEGGAKDRGKAAGWMLAARENGHDPTPRALDELVSKLDPTERAAADRVVAQMGREAPGRMVLPPALSPGVTPPMLIEATPLQYPEDAVEAGAQGIVIVGVVIGVDGRPRDPEVILAAQSRPAVPGDRRMPTGTTRPLAEELLPALLRRRYAPALLDGQPVAVNYCFRVKFLTHGSTLVDETEKERALAAAQNGDARAQFVVGALALRDRKAPVAPENHLVASARAGVPEAQLMVGARLLRHGDASRALPWLERASRAGLAAAHVRYGLGLLERPDPPFAKVRELLSRASEGKEKDRYAARHAVEVLACSKNPAVRDPGAALAVAKRTRLDLDTDPLSQAALAAARASAGEHGAARRAQRDAIDRARRLGWNVSEMEARLSEYEQDLPCEAPFLPVVARVDLPPGR